MDRIQLLRAKIERALVREGKFPEDPAKQEQAIAKLLKVYIKKLEAKEEAKANVKDALKRGYERFRATYAQFFVENEDKLKALSKKDRELTLQKKQEQLCLEYKIPKDAVKDIVARIEDLAKKLDTEPSPSRGSMPSSKFTFSTTKPLSKDTKLVYQAKLNKLAKAGFVTKEDLIANQDDVVKLVESLVADVPDERRAREGRLYFSAIFAAIHGDPLLNKPENPFRTAFRSYSPTTTDKGQAWMKLEDFKNKPEDSE